MERKQIKHEVGQEKDFDAPYCYGYKDIKIDDIIEWLKDCKINGATHVEFRGTEGGDSVCVSPIKIELEPEEEYNKRVQDAKWAEREKKINALQKERELYELLKIKFENGDPFANI